MYINFRLHVFFEILRVKYLKIQKIRDSHIVEVIKLHVIDFSFAFLLIKVALRDSQTSAETRLKKSIMTSQNWLYLISFRRISILLHEKISYCWTQGMESFVSIAPVAHRSYSRSTYCHAGAGFCTHTVPRVNFGNRPSSLGDHRMADATTSNIMCDSPDPKGVVHKLCYLFCPF